MKEWKNILFKTVEERRLYLDLFMPEDAVTPPIIMWVHGGGWNELNRTWSLVMPMLEKGYAIASVDYRYCDEAPFPAQMLDLKDAIVYLRRHAGEYGYDGSKLVLSGDSAGAHLACLAGLSEGNGAWEKPGEDYSVQAIIDISGPASLGDVVPPEAKAGDLGSIEKLLDAPCDSKAFFAAAAAASPLTYIRGGEPPVLIVHGSEDPVVAVTQARKLRNALEAAGDAVHLYYVPGGLHSMGGELLYAVMDEFLRYYLKGEKTVTEPKVLAEHYRARA